MRMNDSAIAGFKNFVKHSGASTIPTCNLFQLDNPRAGETRQPRTRTQKAKPSSFTYSSEAKMKTRTPQMIG